MLAAQRRRRGSLKKRFVDRPDGNGARLMTINCIFRFGEMAGTGGLLLLTREARPTQGHAHAPPMHTCALRVSMHAELHNPRFKFSAHPPRCIIELVLPAAYSASSHLPRGARVVCPVTR
ncbi:hypothetical protein KM043_006417 [Ampulex compressa]|nr:hypothetical protein KM043_006417 [Ampulex compressa]